MIAQQKGFGRLLFGGVLSAAFLASLFFFWPRRPISVVGGTLTKEEQSRIRRLIRIEMCKEHFPDFSWKTVRNAPSSICELMVARMGLIELHSPRYAEVAVRSRFGIHYYWLVNRTGQWSMDSRRRLPSYTPAQVRFTFDGFPHLNFQPPPLNARPFRPKTEAEFSNSLSNQAKLSF